MDNIYYIHLRKDIGKYYWIQKIKNKIGGIIWNGILGIPHDDKYILNFKNKDQCTWAAKSTKIGLFHHFLEHNIEDYIIMFEDDIMPHKKFYKYWKQVL